MALGKGKQKAMWSRKKVNSFEFIAESIIEFQTSCVCDIFQLVSKLSLENRKNTENLQKCE